MTEESSPGREGRRLKDFAHLFLGSGTPRNAPAEGRAGTPAAAPGDHPRVAFLDAGEGWLRTFLAAEIAAHLAQEKHRLLVAEEGRLFPTISGHLGRWLDRTAPTPPIEVVRAESADPDGGGARDWTFVEIPPHLPGWSRPWLARAEFTLVAVAEKQIDRIRAFQLLKYLLGRELCRRTGVIMTEAPGSGRGRRDFHRFTAALPQGSPETLFLGALPLEPLLDREILPQRKPAVIWFPESTTAAALVRAAAALRRALPLEPQVC